VSEESNLDILINIRKIVQYIHCTWRLVYDFCLLIKVEFWVCVHARACLCVCVYEQRLVLGQYVPKLRLDLVVCVCASVVECV
jgi:hypothetical protein